MARYSRLDFKTALPQIEGDVDTLSGDVDTINEWIKSATDFFYPVGTIYETSDEDFDPNKVWGGTWQKIEGKVLVGWDEDDTDFDTVGETGGAKERTLSATIGACNSSTGSLGYITENATTYQNSHRANYVVNGSNTSFSKWNHSTPVVEASSSSRNVSMLPPYEVVVIWKRTA